MVQKGFATCDEYLTCHDTLKVNVDAAHRNGKARYGFVVRDATGTMILAGVGPLYSMVSVAHAELMGL